MIRNELGAHLPWRVAGKYLERLLNSNLVPEIAIKGPELDDLSKHDISQTSKMLRLFHTRPRIHAPFFDLNPGALDPFVRETTKKRLLQTLEFAARLNSSLVVMHPGVDKWRYPNLFDVWLEHALELFCSLLESTTHDDVVIVIENVYEETPDYLSQLITQVDSIRFGHCFDVGHWNLFGTRPMRDWLEQLGPKLFHVHIHDNHGLSDDHLPLGEGEIDFNLLFTHLERCDWPVSMTLEAHSQTDLEKSLKKVQSILS